MECQARSNWLRLNFSVSTSSRVCVRCCKRLRVPFPIAVSAAIPAAGANNWHQSPVHVLQRLGEPTSRALAEEARDLTQKTGGGDLR